MNSRASQLEALLLLSRPLAVVVADLSQFGWDLENPSVSLAPTHISGILNRFLSGEFSAAEVEAWANAIECREDIEYSTASPVGSAIHELANPLLTQPLTMQSAQALAARLSGVAT